VLWATVPLTPPERLFATYFFPLYPPDMRAAAATATATQAGGGGAFEALRRADENGSGNAPGNASLPAHLADAADVFVANAGALFGADVARTLVLDGSDASVHRLSAALTRERCLAWAAQGAPGSADNVLFNAVVHGAAYVGRCIVDSHAAAWRIRRPLWESVVRLPSRAGEADLPVFHWWLKSLAEGSPDGAAEVTLADRYRAYVEIPCAQAEALPVLTTHERALPRLKTPTYDRLYKYLRAHLPEIRDLGHDFPSAERFAAFEFRWIEAHFLGGARMVLLAGASPKGMHLFWLGAHGFEKAAFFAGDAFPDPVVKIREDKILVMTSVGGEPQTYETLWWGP
jgi:hypothetical protein